MRLPLRLLLSSVVLVLALVAADRILAIAGLPSEHPAFFAHPPNFSEDRINLDFEHAFRTNSRGLRDHEVPVTKAPGEKRLLILGDSFVEGYGVELEETFVSRLQTAHAGDRPPIRFINGGLSGAGPREYARLYFQLGADLDLDWVVLCIYPNDLTGTNPAESTESIYALPERSRLRAGLHAMLPTIYTRISMSGLLSRGRSESFIQQVHRRAREIGRSELQIAQWTATLPREIVQAIDSGRFNGAILASGLLTPEYWVESLDLDGPTALAKWEAMASILDEIAKMAKQNRHRLALAYLPSRFQYAPAGANRRLWEQSGTQIKDAWRFQDSALQQRLREWSSQRSLPLLDLTPGFRAHAEMPSLVFPRDDHWTRNGHRLAAEIIDDWLSDIGALPTRSPS